ncbi:20998_t:CDS:1, partial [Dentiscutata erythropus]
TENIILYVEEVDKFNNSNSNNVDLVKSSPKKQRKRIIWSL